MGVCTLCMLLMLFVAIKNFSSKKRFYRKINQQLDTKRWNVDQVTDINGIHKVYYLTGHLDE